MNTDGHDSRAYNNRHGCSATPKEVRDQQQRKERKELDRVYARKPDEMHFDPDERRGCHRMGSSRRQPPVTSIVGEQSARCTASAIATSTSRGPSKRSLPCAVRTLSTSIRSPACHRSRAVFAS